MTDALAGVLPLAAEEAGEGPLLVLVHGELAGGRMTFGGLVPALVDRYRVLVVDRPGFERTGGSGDVSVREQADRLLATIQRLDGPAHAVGLSFGGLVVLRALQQRPEAFATITLLEVPAIDLCPPDMVEPEQLVRRLRQAHSGAEDGASVAEVFAEVDPGLWAALGALLRRGDPGVTAVRGDLAVWDAALDRYRLADVVAGERPIGVLAVSGSASAPAFRSFGACTAAALAGRHHVIAGAGHAAHLHPAFPALLDEHTGVAR